MINITYEQLTDTLRTLGYPVWVKPYDLNAFGIRNPSRVPNTFDDTIGIAYTDCDNRKRILLCPATTDPGLDYLLNPMSNKGTAIMCEGYYKKLWTRGLHKGYPAMVQKSPARFIRDNNKDTVLNFESKNIVTEIIGANLHRAHQTLKAMKVGKYSAGCQVVQMAIDLSHILGLVDLQIKYVKTPDLSYALMSEGNIS